MRQYSKYSHFWLGLAGLGAASISAMIPSTSQLKTYSIGCLFGIALASYVKFFERHQRTLSLVTFVLVCSVIFPLAELSGFEGTSLLHARFRSDSQLLSIPYEAGFIGGFVGNMILFIAVSFFLSERNILNWATLVNALYLSSGGGILGVAGVAAQHWWQAATQAESLNPIILVWQPGVAFILGAYLERRSRGLTNVCSTPVLEERENIRPWYGKIETRVVLSLAILGWLGFVLYRIVEADRLESESVAASERYLKTQPPSKGLARPPEVSIGQELILEEIGTFYPWAPFARPYGLLGVEYNVGYTETKNPAPINVRQVVSAQVIRWPNVYWAQYVASNPQSNLLVVDPGALSRVKRGDNTVIQNEHNRYPNGGGNVCFHWPSGTASVSLCFETTRIDDLVLKRYLDRYPSNL